MNKFLLGLVITLATTFSVQAAQWKLSHEVNTSETRKVCVYEDKEGNTRQVEQSQGQYCRTYL